MASFGDKFRISAGSAVLFALVNLPQTYRFTDSLLPFNLYNQSTGCPTSLGLLFHTVVFVLISYLTMGGRGSSSLDSQIKLKHSLYGGLIFFLVSSPAMYSLTSSLFGPEIASRSGCPSTMGVLVHAAVYCAILVAVMYLP